MGVTANNSVRLAVLSDLHAWLPDKGAMPSHYHTVHSDVDIADSPVAALRSLITHDRLEADLVVCPGDLGHQANLTAVSKAWHDLHGIKKSLNAKRLLVTTGNHDIDSRHAHTDFDARGQLQRLSPTYPFEDDALNDRYWSRHFVTIIECGIRFLVLNSSAYHGEGRKYDNPSTPWEFEHGRVSPFTLQRIETELESEPHSAFNVAVVHHHPHEHSDLGLGRDDLMLGGSDLLTLLGSGRFGEWLVIHGHKHHARIESAKGGAGSPWVFAAGSLCANLSGLLATEARNQFYMLELPLHATKEHGFVWKFRSWEWRGPRGWQPASQDSAIPDKGGFGWRGSLPALADRIATIVAKSLTPWPVIHEQCPELDYVCPTDIRTLIAQLDRRHGLIADPPNAVPPHNIGPAL